MAVSGVCCQSGTQSTELPFIKDLYHWLSRFSNDVPSIRIGCNNLLRTIPTKVLSFSKGPAEYLPLIPALKRTKHISHKTAAVPPVSYELSGGAACAGGWYWETAIKNT